MSGTSSRVFVIVGTTAVASGEFSIDDIPSTGGRIDVLLRCVRAALLYSHGVRRDASVVLVLQGGDRGPRTVRIDGATAKFLRPDERSLGALVKKSLTTASAMDVRESVEVRPGVFVREGGLDAALSAFEGAGLYVLDEGAPDIRDASVLAERASVFVIGDHRGFDGSAREVLEARGAVRVGLGPVSVHAEDAVSVVNNELDRRWSVGTT